MRSLASALSVMRSSTSGTSGAIALGVAGASRTCW
ncbi:Uncharacterised protein [Mycobacteroides abscessus]|nr:Uncharacterised protein [Mycobacteroides abscessus]